MRQYILNITESIRPLAVRVIIFILVSAAGISFSYAQVQNTTWRGTQSSDWFDAANWSNGVPGPNGRVTIGWINADSHQPVINGNTSFQRLTMQSNNNTLTIESGSVVNVSQTVSISNTSRLIAGNIQFTAGGNLTSQGSISMEAGRLQVGGNLSTSGLVTETDMGAADLVVSGNFSSSGNFRFGQGNMDVQGSFSVENAQNFFMNAGILNIYGVSSLGGNLTIDHAAVVNLHNNFTVGNSSNLNLIDGVVNFLGNAVLSGEGSFNVTGGTVNFAANSTFNGSGQFNLSSGEVNFTGNSTFSGSSVFNAGQGQVYFGENVTLSGSGIVNAQESTIIMDGATWAMIGGAEFNPGTSTVVFSGNTHLISGAGGINQITFYNLIIEGTTDVLSLINVIVLNDMGVDAGAQFENTPGTTLNVIGIVTGDPFIDSSRPYIIAINPISVNTISLLFNGPLSQASAENIANYQVENMPSPVSATLDTDNPERVTLVLGFEMVQETAYFLIANNIQNLSGGTISENHRKRFGTQAPAFDPAVIAAAIEAAQAAQATYLAAGGNTEDAVNVSVTNAISALEALLAAEPLDAASILSSLGQLNQLVADLNQAILQLILSDILSDAAAAIEAAQAAQADYLAAGGNTEDVVNVAVTNAVSALQVLMTAEPLNGSAIVQAITTLNLVVNELILATDQVLAGVLAQAQSALAAVPPVQSAFLAVGGQTTDPVYVQLGQSVSGLQSLINSTPLNGLSLIAATANLLDDLAQMQLITQQWLVPSLAHSEAAISMGRAGTPTQITITLRNANNLPLAGKAAAIALNLSGANTSGLSAVADMGNGVYSAAYTPTVTGQDVLTIMINGEHLPGSPFTYVIAAGEPAVVQLIQPGGSVVKAGAPISPAPVVVVRDAYNNLVPGVQVFASINKAFFCSLCQRTIITDEEGIAEYRNLVVNKADTGYMVSFFALKDNGTPVNSSGFALTVTPDAADRAEIIGPTTTMPGVLSGKFELILTDRYGNPTKATDNMVFTLYSTSPSVSFVPNNQVSINAGQSKSNFRYRDNIAGFQIIRAVLSGIQPATKSLDGAGLAPDKSFDPAEFEVEVTDHWVWVAQQGVSSNNWAEGENWNKGIGSPGNGEVVILRNRHSDVSPVISTGTNVTVGTLILDGDLTITVGPTTNVTVQNIQQFTKTNHPLVYIQSDETGTGSFLQQNAGLSGVVERHFGGTSSSWHMIASPVASQSIAGSTKDFTSGALFTWYEPSQSWVSFNNHMVWPRWSDAHPAGEQFLPGRGYIARYEDNPTKTFEGQLNFGQIELGLMRYAHRDDPYVGFNLVGNPYTASVDWKASGWTGREQLASPEIWVWNDAIGQYGSYHVASASDLGSNGAGRYIAPMQAFWVRANNHGQVFGMNNNVRAHAPLAGTKDAQQERGILRLQVASSATPYQDELVIEFGHNGQFPGAEKKFSMYAQAPSLYTTRDNTHFSISFEPSLQGQRAIPVNFSAGVNGEYSLNISTIEGFTGLILEDLQTGIKHRLQPGRPYVFTAQRNDSPGRFVLHVQSDQIVSAPEVPADEPLHAYVWQQTLYVNANAERTQLSVFDLQGRQLLQRELSGSGLHSLAVNLPKGIYVVRAISGNQTLSTRVVLQ